MNRLTQAEIEDLSELLATYVKEPEAHFAFEDMQEMAPSIIYELLETRRELAEGKARIEELEGALRQNAEALNPFIYKIAHTFDELSQQYYWTEPPTREEGQAAMEANNNALAALTPSNKDAVR